MMQHNLMKCWHTLFIAYLLSSNILWRSEQETPRNTEPTDYLTHTNLKGICAADCTGTYIHIFRSLLRHSLPPRHPHLLVSYIHRWIRHTIILRQGLFSPTCRFIFTCLCIFHFCFCTESDAWYFARLDILLVFRWLFLVPGLHLRFPAYFYKQRMRTFTPFFNMWSGHEPARARQGWTARIPHNTAHYFPVTVHLKEGSEEAGARKLVEMRRWGAGVEQGLHTCCQCSSRLQAEEK